jgi:hypothetical protein
MAASSISVKGFKFRKNLAGLEHPAVLDFILDDSATFTLGDAVRLDTDGLLTVNGAGNTILGILSGIVDQNGQNVFVPGRASGTEGSTLTPDDTITTSSTNSTDGTRKLKGQVILDPAGTNLYYNDANGNFAQTNVGQCFDLTASGDQVDQGTATDGSAQVQLLQIDPDGDGDASKGLFRIVEEQY